MITITPQGSVYLCKTPLENDYQHQLTFANATAQLTYFNSKIQYTCNDVTYIKKDNQIVVDYPIDTIITCNYLFYKNTGFTTKYYYCFITNMEYVNENATRITFETDVYQTYMFDITFKKSFVEREHVNDDTIGKNTVPEGLDTGEFMINSFTKIDEYTGSHVVIGATKVPDDFLPIESIYDSQTDTYSARDTTYNGIFGGVIYIAFETNKDAASFIEYMTQDGKVNDIVSVFMIPNTFFSQGTTWSNFPKTITIGSYTFDLSFKYTLYPTEVSERVLVDNKTISINSTLNGYTPKNNKMFTKEFNYMYVTNNNGGDTTYAYEDFILNTPGFRVISAITPGASIRLIPQNYKGLDRGTLGTHANECMNYGLTGGKYPTCSWQNDAYTNWLTQNSINYSLDKLGTAAGVGLLAATNPLLVGIAGINTILECMQEKVKRETTPIQASGNINSGDVTFTSSMSSFCCYQMSVRYEFAKRIDDYFSTYGYKVNEIKVPNVTGRTYWNYVKTVGCNLEGDIPQEYINKLKEMFNNGVTLWHDTTKFLDYSQNNTIVTPTP